MKRTFLCSLVVLLMVGLLTACGNSQSNGQADNEGNQGEKGKTGAKVTWSIGTSSSGSSPYVIGGAVNKVINAGQDLIDSSPEVTGGYVENLALVNEGSINVGLNSIDILSQAYNGKDKFEGKAMPDLRALFNVAFLPVHVTVLADSNINSGKDLAGKKFSISQPSQSTRTLAMAYLEANGLTQNDIDAKQLSTTEALTALKDKQIDGSINASTLPFGGVTELAVSHDIKLLPIEGEEADKMLQILNNTLVKSVIPGGTYKGVDQDVPTLASPSLLFVRKDADEEEVYQLTKAFFDNLEQYHKDFPGGATLTLENALDGINIPIHPGAERYFKEKGIIK